MRRSKKAVDYESNNGQKNYPIFLESGRTRQEDGSVGQELAVPS